MNSVDIKNNSEIARRFSPFKQARIYIPDA
jgi:hypothetical protein